MSLSSNQKKNDCHMDLFLPTQKLTKTGKSLDFPNPRDSIRKNVKTVRSEQIRLLKFILENTLQQLKMRTANKAVLGRFPLAAF